MKTIKLLMIAAIMAFSFSSFANDGNTKGNNISKFISNQLQSDYLSVLIENEMDVKIEFYINSDNEIVVMNTDSENEELDRYIKSHLNYSELDVENVRHKEPYFITIQFKMSNK